MMIFASILVHGHRGARAVLPENTIPAFEHAIAAGADFIEVDIAFTRDNVPVISHDPSLPEAICTGPGGTRVVREMTLAELRRWDCGGALGSAAFPKQKAVPGTRVPTLDEVLALGERSNIRFNIETKIFKDRPNLTPPPDEYARLLYEAIRRRGMERRVVVQSFDFRTLHAMKRIAPDVPLAALFGGKETRDWAVLAREAGAPAVAPEHVLVTRERVEAAHKAGLKVVPWTVNAPADWDRVIDAGVDAIITDDPAALIEHLKARGLHAGARP